MENTEYKELVRKLEQSPLFNVSLASKELFHSNFIYWISMINKGVFKDIIAALLGIKNENLKWGDNWDVRREYEHFDLCVVNSSQNLLKDKGDKKQKNKDIILFVLENKVKSIPTKIQLDEYWEKSSIFRSIEKLENELNNINDDKKKKQKEKEIKEYKEILESATQHYLLLSLSTIFPDKQALVDDKKWVIRDYKYLSKCLSNKLLAYASEKDNSTSLEQNYIQYIVRDYCSYTESLQQLMNIWSSGFATLKQPYIEDYKAEKIDQEKDNEYSVKDSVDSNYMYQTARKLRLHDVYGKIRIAILKQKLEKYLDERLKDKIQKYKNEGLVLEVAYAYTNATPLLEVMIKQKESEILKKGRNERFVLHIQLQGYQYRHAINEIGRNVEESVKNIIENENYHFFLYPDSEKKNEGLERKCEYPKLYGEEDGSMKKSFAGVTYEITRQKLGQRSGFCKYGGKDYNFIYQWKQITENSTVEDIFKAILTDIYNILSHIEKFYYHTNDDKVDIVDTH